MAKMEFISDYKDDNELRGQFNHLTQEIFGFDFEEWYQRGFWDDRYVCYSFFENGQIVSNVSATTFELVINGKVFHAIQIGTVMTKRAFRGNGLGVELTRKVFDKYRSACDFFYLFGHNKVWDYYTKQDFIPIVEWSYSIDANKTCDTSDKLRRLNLFNTQDIEIILRLTKKRVPISKTLGVLHDTSVFLFYGLNMYSENLFYSDSYDCLLVFTIHEKKVVQIYDVLCETELHFTDIMHLISSEVQDIQKILFHYTPTYPDMTIHPGERISGDKMFFKGNRSILPSHFTYPKIAHT